MKKYLLHSIFITSFSLNVIHILAQGVHSVSGEPLKYCGQAEATESLLKEFPQLKGEGLAPEKPATSIIPNLPPPVYTIPVVFHVLHNYGP